MEIPGRVQGGVVVLEGGASLPEGVPVMVSYPARISSQSIAGPKRRVQLPLVHSDQPGSVHLTGERIAEILDDDDAPSRR